MTQADCRLYLFAPREGSPEEASARIADALSGGDVAALLASPELAKICADITGPAGVALMIAAGNIRDLPEAADGIHFEAKNAKAIKTLTKQERKQLMAGIGGLKDRHSAMQAGEFEPDYVMLGDPANETPTDPDLVEWWSALFTVPSVALIGDDLDHAVKLARSGADFVAAGEAVWNYPEGPAAAVRLINQHFHQGQSE